MSTKQNSHEGKHMRSTGHTSVSSRDKVAYKKRKTARKRFRFPEELPVWQEVLLHILAIAVALVIFALPHHVIGYEKKGLGIQSSRNSVPVTETTSTIPDPAGNVQTADPVSHTQVGDFSARFADKFITGPAQFTGTTYVSENVNITITDYNENHVVFHVADIYIRDISCLQRALAQDRFGRNLNESILSVVPRVTSVVTISGDYYSMRNDGVVEVNGTLLANDLIHNDICVLYWDGTVRCFSKDDFNCDLEMRNGAYQMWNFGPALMDENGLPLSEYPERYNDIISDVPRAAFGYYEPGHYCFVAVDGRSSESKGLTLHQMSLLAEQLGLKQLYNLDGGKTAWMCFGTDTVNVPANGGRECSDYICVIDKVTH